MKLENRAPEVTPSSADSAVDQPLARRFLPDGAAVKSGLTSAALYAICIAVALGLCALLVRVTGGDAGAVFSALLDGSFRSPGAWGLTVTTAVPLLAVASGTILCTRAGFTNIGQEGQLILGAAAFAYVATRLDAPGPILLTASLAAGVAMGMLWVGIAALMRFTRQVPEVISTLLLVFIAYQISNYALTERWLLLTDQPGSGTTNSGTPLPAGARLPTFTAFGNQVTIGVFLVLALTMAIAFLIARTTIGFRLRMLGMNARTARRAGVAPARYGGAAMLVSGATAGLAGGLWLSGGAAGDRFTAGISSNLGWQGLLVALLARDRALVAVPMALIFAALRTGSGFLAATGVERRIADVVQAMLVFALLTPPAIRSLQRRRAPKEASA